MCVGALTLNAHNCMSEWVCICRVMWKQILFFYLRSKQQWQQQHQHTATAAHKAMINSFDEEKRRKMNKYNKKTHVWKPGNDNHINKYNNKTLHVHSAAHRESIWKYDRVSGDYCCKSCREFFGSCNEAIRCKNILIKSKIWFRFLTKRPIEKRFEAVVTVIWNERELVISSLAN